MRPIRADHLFHVPPVMCEACVVVVTSAVRTVDAAAHVEADVEARIVRVVSDAYPSVLMRTLGEAGYPAEPILQPLG
ncbi:MAG TPA: cation transporter [Microvirga sp.]|jgi:copper chaperone CopZ